MNSSAWDRQRATIRDEIAKVSRQLFSVQGFDDTTIEQISSLGGISKRTFFRYFGTKEDVLFADMIGLGDALVAAVQARPESEDAWSALVAAIGVVRTADGAGFLADRETAKLMWDSSALRARHLEKRHSWAEQLVPHLIPRARGGHAPLEARAVAACVLSCHDVATEAWVRDGGDFDALLAQALASVRGVVADD